MRVRCDCVGCKYFSRQKLEGLLPVVRTGLHGLLIGGQKFAEGRWRGGIRPKWGMTSSNHPLICLRTVVTSYHNGNGSWLPLLLVTWHRGRHYRRNILSCVLYLVNGAKIASLNNAASRFAERYSKMTGIIDDCGVWFQTPFDPFRFAETGF